MDQEIQGQLGQEAKYEVAFKDGVASVSVIYQGKYAGASASVNVPAKALAIPLLEKLKSAIPGDWDDALIDKLISEL